VESASFMRFNESVYGEEEARKHNAMFGFHFT